MRVRARHLLACFAVAAAVPAAATAEQAFTLRDTEAFAGPSSEYPSIAQLPPNAAVNVVGCLSNWSWCDVSFGPDRGWVYAADLAVAYENRRVVVIEYGPRIHLPVVTFSLVAYWDQHYRARPFYAERQQWVSRVHIEASRGGRPPAGHERTAQQSAPSSQLQQAQPQQAPTQTAKPAERSSQAPRTESARSAESARAPKEAQEPQRKAPEVAQSSQSDESREQRRPLSAQRPSSPQGQERADQAPKAEPSPKAQGAEQVPQPPRAAPSPRAARPPEAKDQREAGKAQGEEKSGKEERLPKQEEQPESRQQ